MRRITKVFNLFVAVQIVGRVSSVRCVAGNFYEKPQRTPIHTLHENDVVTLNLQFEFKHRSTWK